MDHSINLFEEYHLSSAGSSFGPLKFSMWLSLEGSDCGRVSDFETLEQEMACSTSI